MSEPDARRPREFRWRCHRDGHVGRLPVIALGLAVAGWAAYQAGVPAAVGLMTVLALVLGVFASTIHRTFGVVTITADRFVLARNGFPRRRTEIDLAMDAVEAIVLEHPEHELPGYPNHRLRVVLRDGREHAIDLVGGVPLGGADLSAVLTDPGHPPVVERPARR